MKYLLSGAALLVLVAAGPAWANNVFDCQDVGVSAPEPIGDAEGHALLTGTFSCRLTAGPMAGGLLTGTTTWEMNKGEGTLISGTGVIRKPGSLVVYKDTEGTLKLTMDDKGGDRLHWQRGGHLGVRLGRRGSPEGQEGWPGPSRRRDRAPSPSTRRLISPAKNHAACQ